MLLTFLLTIPAISQQDKQIKLVFAGDIMCHQTQLISAYDSTSNSYSFDSYFENISHLIKSADIAFANLETTFPGENYTGYPAFGSPDRLLLSIKQAGFDCLFTANNHSLDKGYFALERTINLLNQYEILHTGTFSSSEEKELINPLIIESNGFKISLLNYTYGINSGHFSQSYMINTIDTTAILSDINKSNESDVDLIICYMHWGDEYKETQSENQNLIANWMHNHGVKLIIGSHPHVVQPVVALSKGGTIDQLCAFSLGNLISNQRTGKRKEGLILEINLSISNDKLTIVNYIKHPTFVQRTSGKEDGIFDFLITLPSLPAPISQTAGL